MHQSDRNAVREAVQGFYEQHPYPPPPSDLENYRKRWEDEGRRRADFHLHFPETVCLRERLPAGEDVNDGDFTNHVHLDSSRLINGPAHRDALKNESV
jgi:hypothetical protein